MKEIRKKLKKDTCYTTDRTVLKIIFDEKDKIDVRLWFNDIGKAIIERDYPKNCHILVYSRRVTVIKGSKLFPNDPNHYTIL